MNRFKLPKIFIPASVFALTSSLLLGSILFTKSTNAAECTSCPSGSYSCQNGSMCCTCGSQGCGCPSFTCQEPSLPPGYTVSCSWDGATGGDPNKCTCVIRNPTDGTTETRTTDASYVGGTCSACGVSDGGGGSGGGLCCKKGCPSGNGQCGLAADQVTPKYWCKQESQCTDGVLLECNTTRYEECTNNCPSGQRGDACEYRRDGSVKTRWCTKYKCFQSNVQGPISTSGATGTYPMTASIQFLWDQPKSWGNVCSSPCNSGGFKLFVDGQEKGSYNVNADTTTISASTFGPGVHSWYIQAWRTGASSANSATLSFTVLADTVDVQGYIWNATDKACTSSPSGSDEIVRGSAPGNVPSDITVTMDGTISGTWDTSQSGYSYQFTDVTTGSHLITANVPDPVGFPNSKYVLSCVDDEQSSAAAVNAQSDPTTLHLGYKIISAGWFNVINGDVYGACHEDNCAESVSVGIPAQADVLGGFAAALIDGTATVFGNSDLSVKNSTDQDAYTSDSNNFYLKNINTTGSPAENFSFITPSFAEDAPSGCGNIFKSGNLDPDKVYKATRGCVQGGLNGLNQDYDLASDGVVVIFVESDGPTLSFNDDFKSSSDNERIVFVTEAPVEITSAIGDAAPTSATEPHIQASIISKANITFLGKGGNEEDTTVIVEGPLVSTEGQISFERDRILNNGYPAQVVSYNPIYLNSLSQFGTKGLGIVDISWILQN